MGEEFFHAFCITLSSIVERLSHFMQVSGNNVLQVASKVC